MEEKTKELLEMLEANNIEGFLNNIDEMAASKAYLIIRDNISHNHIKMIEKSGKDNYQKFQDIKLRAKKSWDYDHKLATIEEVNKACVNVYTLVLRLLRANNDSITDEFNKLRIVINKMEEQAGMDITNWDTDNVDDGGNDNVNDVQRVKEDI